MSGDAREDGWTLPPEDDWFADVEEEEASAGRPDEGDRRAEGARGGQPPHPPPAARGRLLALAVAAVALVVVGVLFARWVGGSDDSGTVSPTLPTVATTLPATPTPQPVTPPAPPASTVPEETTTTPQTIDLPPDGKYRRGDQGDSVLAIQQALTALELDPGKIDGIFGAETENAVIAFQGSVELPQDGVVGVATLEALSNALDTRG